MPREQLREQHSESAPQLPPSETHTEGARQTPAEQVRPEQQPAPHACPAAEQVVMPTQVPLTQLAPPQHSPL